MNGEVKIANIAALESGMKRAPYRLGRCSYDEERENFAIEFYSFHRALLTFVW